MDKYYFETYKKILEKYKYPFQSKQEIFEIMENTRLLTTCLRNFEKGRAGQLKNKKPNLSFVKKKNRDLTN
jgi:hypothetical protein